MAPSEAGWHAQTVAKKLSMVNRADDTDIAPTVNLQGMHRLFRVGSGNHRFSHSVYAVRAGTNGFMLCTRFFTSPYQQS